MTRYVVTTFRGEQLVTQVSKYADPLCLRLSLFRAFHHVGLRLEDIVVVDSDLDEIATYKNLQNQKYYEKPNNINNLSAGN